MYKGVYCLAKDNNHVRIGMCAHVRVCVSVSVCVCLCNHYILISNIECLYIHFGGNSDF